MAPATVAASASGRPQTRKASVMNAPSAAAGTRRELSVDLDTLEPSRGIFAECRRDGLVPELDFENELLSRHRNLPQTSSRREIGKVLGERPESFEHLCRVPALHGLNQL